MSAAFFSQKGKREREKGLWPVSHVKVNKFYVRTAYLFWGGDFLWRGALREKKKKQQIYHYFLKGQAPCGQQKGLEQKEASKLRQKFVKKARAARKLKAKRRAEVPAK